MPNKPTHKGQIVLETIDRFPKSPSRQLARILREEHPQIFDSEVQALTAVRYYRGAAGAANNHKRKTLTDRKQQTAESREPFRLPPTSAVAWEPYSFPEEFKRPLILSDLHLPYHSEFAIDKAVKYGRRKQVDSVLLNGDVLDCYQASTKYERNPEKRRLAEEVETAEQFLDWLQQELKVPIFFKFGNHEERWDRLLWAKGAELLGIANIRLHEQLNLDIRGITLITDQRPILFGKDYTIMHGHEMPKGMTNPVSPARGAYLRAAINMMCGHWHRTTTHAQADAYHKTTIVHSTGCLCDMNPEYARINQWNHGFAIAYRNNHGVPSVDNLRIETNGDIHT